MSKRHQSSRRKAYGKRQHEVRERHDRTTQYESTKAEHDESGAGAPADPFSFFDPRAPRYRFALGD